MVTTYPSKIDNNISLPDVIDKITDINGQVINRLKGAILAIETELGAKPSGIYTTVKNRLDFIESAIGSGGGFLPGGDLSGTGNNQRVIGLQTRPISNLAPSINQALIWDGLAWTPGNSGAGIVFGGDLSGTDTSQIVEKISGNAGIVNILANDLVFDSSITPVIEQSQALSGAGKNFTIRTQAAATSSSTTGGNLLFRLGKNDTGTNALAVEIEDSLGGTPWQILHMKRNGGFVANMTMGGGYDGVGSFCAGSQISSYPLLSIASHTMVNIGVASDDIGANAFLFVDNNHDGSDNDEAALDWQYTTNKSGGNDIGFRINKTDTASPGTSRYLDIRRNNNRAVSILQTTGNSAALVFENIPATDGYIRLPNAAGIFARNAANSQNLPLINSDSSNRILIGDLTGNVVNTWSRGQYVTAETQSGNYTQIGPTNYDISAAAVNVLGAGVIALTGVPATTGNIRLPNAGSIYFRNADNSANTNFAVLDVGNNLTIGDWDNVANFSIRALTAHYYYVGNTNEVLRIQSTNILMQVPTFQFTEGVSSPNIKQAARTSNAATNDLTITAQAPFALSTGSNRNAGNLNFVIPTEASGGTAGAAKFNTGGSTLSIIKTPGLPGNQITSDGTYIFFGGASNATQLQGGNMSLGVAGSAFTTRFAGVWGFNVDHTTTDITFLGTSNLNSLKYGFEDLATNSGTGANIIIAGQNETGTTSTGGNVLLSGGTGTTTDGYVSSTSKFVMQKGMRRALRTITTNSNALLNDDIILIGSISTTVTITLPASPIAGTIYDIKDGNGNASTYGIIINGNGKNIDGVASRALATDYENVTIIYNGSQWSAL